MDTSLLFLLIPIGIVLIAFVIAGVVIRSVVGRVRRQVDGVLSSLPGPNARPFGGTYTRTSSGSSGHTDWQFGPDWTPDGGGGHGHGHHHGHDHHHHHHHDSGWSSNDSGWSSSSSDSGSSSSSDSGSSSSSDSSSSSSSDSGSSSSSSSSD